MGTRFHGSRESGLVRWTCEEAPRTLSPELHEEAYGYLIFDKGGKNIYNGAKTASSISGAGKTRQLHVNE